MLSLLHSEVSDIEIVTLCEETDDPLNHAKHVNAIVERGCQFSHFPFVVHQHSCSSSVSDQFFGLFLIF